LLVLFLLLVRLRRRHQLLQIPILFLLDFLVVEKQVVYFHFLLEMALNFLILLRLNLLDFLGLQQFLENILDRQYHLDQLHLLQKLYLKKLM
jgi:hypothetical protein